jgi:hypothetical protein
VVDFRELSALCGFADLETLQRAHRQWVEQPGDELHALGYDIPASVFHQEMDMVGCHHVVQYGETEPLLCCKDPMQVPAPIARKL